MPLLLGGIACIPMCSVRAPTFQVLIYAICNHYIILYHCCLSCSLTVPLRNWISRGFEYYCPFKSPSLKPSFLERFYQRFRCTANDVRATHSQSPQRHDCQVVSYEVLSRSRVDATMSMVATGRSPEATISYGDLVTQSQAKKCNPSKNQWDLTNGPLSKVLELLDTQV